MRWLGVRPLSVISVVLCVVAVIHGGSAAGLSTPFGQTQAYDVLLRGNTEAIVNARITITNADGDFDQSLSYEQENGTIRDIVAYQQISCYDEEVIVPMDMPATSSSSATQGATAPSSGAGNAVSRSVLPECYSGVTTSKNYNYPNVSYVYKKATVEQIGNSFRVVLPYNVKSGRSATVVMAYDISGIVKKRLGVFSYDFKTLKGSQAVSSAIVSVSVDEGYQLAGATRSQINYRPSAVGTNLSTELGASASATDASKLGAVNEYVQQIGQIGSITKQASRLQPNESFSVEGRYARSAFLLNWLWIVFGGIGVLLLLVVLIYLYVRRRKQLVRSAKPRADHMIPSAPQEQASGDPSSDMTDSNSDIKSPMQPPRDAATVTRPVNINVQAIPFYGAWTWVVRAFRQHQIRPIFFGWICALLAILVVLSFVGIYALLSRSTDYYYASLSTFDIVVLPTFMVTSGLIAVLTFLFVAVGLPILYAGSFRRAIRIFWHMCLVVFVLTLIVGLIGLRQRERGVPEPVYGQSAPTVLCDKGGICN